MNFVKCLFLYVCISFLSNYDEQHYYTNAPYSCFIFFVVAAVLIIILVTAADAPGPKEEAAVAVLHAFALSRSFFVFFGQQRG